MEIAIPLIALGGLYVVSNQGQGRRQGQGQGVKEKYTNMGKPGYNSNLWNVEPIVENYPVESQLDTSVNQYNNPNTVTDKYFDQNVYQNRVNEGVSVGQTPKDIYSLTGDYLDSKQFKHNNMVPFVGGKIKSYTYDMNIAETILDNHVGLGSQVIKKIEQGPLFRPEENISWAYGTPNQTDFIQSRINPGMISNNVKPFESVMVGPGLGQGYTTDGVGGYNSGMMDRDAWLDRSVDELRVETNPKLSYTLDGLQGASYAHVQNRGIIGVVEKQHPDTYFINTQDRWLTTTGAEKAQMLRPIEELGIVKREDAASNYMGTAVGATQHAGYTPTSYEQPKRVATSSLDVGVSNAAGHGPANDGEAFIQSYASYNNNRNTTNQPDTFRNAFNSVIGAVVAPLMDALKPTRKQDTLKSAVYGAGNKSGHMIYDAAYIQTNNDLKSTTIANRPNQGGMQVFNQHMNVTTYRSDTDRTNNRLFTPAAIVPLSSGIDNIGALNTPQQYDYAKTGVDRINPDLLSAFRANPYTHCLTSSA